MSLSPLSDYSDDEHFVRKRARRQRSKWTIDLEDQGERRMTKATTATIDKRLLKTVNATKATTAAIDKRLLKK
jgi:hypothetical protein